MVRNFALSALFSLSLTFLLFTAPAYSQQVRQLQQADLPPRAISVENLHAEYYSSSSMITVRARLTNVSQHVIKGYITIYLLAEDGSNLFAFDEKVNNGNPFGLRQSVDFEASAKVKNLNKASTISVDFTED